MNTYDIFYSLHPEFHNPPVRTVADIFRTHAYVYTVDGDSLDEAYAEMQAHAWQPTPDDIEYLKKVGVHHASMSIDDILHCYDTDKWYQVVEVGFRQIF